VSGWERKDKKSIAERVLPLPEVRGMSQGGDNSPGRGRQNGRDVVPSSRRFRS
jgi:hypothetical protein